MSEDICDRLVRFNWDKQCISTDIEVEAAAEITRLREENARLREALKDLIEEDEYQTCSGEEDDGIARAAARAAIRKGETK